MVPLAPHVTVSTSVLFASQRDFLILLTMRHSIHCRRGVVGSIRLAGHKKGDGILSLWAPLPI